MKPKLFFKRNSSTILTVLGCAGVVATAVLSAKAAPKAKRLLANAELEKGEELTVLEKTETVALTYLPVILTGSATIFCICGAQILNQHQQASMASASGTEYCGGFLEQHQKIRRYNGGVLYI